MFEVLFPALHLCKVDMRAHQRRILPGDGHFASHRAILSHKGNGEEIRIKGHERAQKLLLFVHRGIKLYVKLISDVSDKVPVLLERPVKADGGHGKIVCVWDRIRLIQNGVDRMAHALAVIERYAFRRIDLEGEHPVSLLFLIFYFIQLKAQRLNRCAHGLIHHFCDLQSVPSPSKQKSGINAHSFKPQIQLLLTNKIIITGRAVLSKHNLHFCPVFGLKTA